MIALIMSASNAAASGSGAVAFDPNQELSPDPGFDNASAWSTVGTCDVNTTVASALDFRFRGSNVTAPAAHTIVPGTYRLTMTVINYGVPGGTGTNGQTSCTIGGTNASDPGFSANGVVVLDIVVATVTDQNIIIGCVGQPRKLFDLSDCTVRQIA